MAFINEKKEITEQDFDINPDLEPGHKAVLLSLLMEFKDRFAANPQKHSVTQIREQQIDVFPTATPVKAKCFRMSLQQEEEVTRQAEEMIRNGIACPSSSPWESNVILLKQLDGSTRIVTDYRQLNDLTIKDSYPMPNVRM